MMSSSNVQQIDAIEKVTVQHHQQDYVKYILRHPSSPTTLVEVYTFGATITKWQILGQDIIFCSTKTLQEAGKAIRGGIPIVFPQFGPGKLPQHGFARVSQWTLSEASINKSTGDVTAIFTLTDDEKTRQAWPYKFTCRYHIVLKATSLSIQLEVINNETEQSFDFTSLQHTYLQVNDIHDVLIKGLQKYRYIDKVDGGAEKIEESNELQIVGEVDRIYIDAARNGNTIVVSERHQNGEVLVKCTGFTDIVVWNIGSEKVKGMKDMDDSEYAKYVCIEAGTVVKPITLKPNEKWSGACGLSLRIVGQSASHL